jgi:NADH-quinone oxidoreductase subunit A
MNLSLILNLEYIYIIISFVIASVLAIVIILLSYILVFQNSDFEKNSAYECGFQPFEEARSQFDVRFYLVAILFIIFDLEIMFLFPWSVSLFLINLFGFYSMCLFLIILTLGFIYEWKKGALDWQ